MDYKKTLKSGMSYIPFSDHTNLAATSRSCKSTTIETTDNLTSTGQSPSRNFTRSRIPDKPEIPSVEQRRRLYLSYTPPSPNSVNKYDIAVSQQLQHGEQQHSLSKRLLPQQQQPAETCHEANNWSCSLHDNRLDVLNDPDDQNEIAQPMRRRIMRGEAHEGALCSRNIDAVLPEHESARATSAGDVGVDAVGTVKGGVASLISKFQRQSHIVGWARTGQEKLGRVQGREHKYSAFAVHDSPKSDKQTCQLEDVSSITEERTRSRINNTETTTHLETLVSDVSGSSDDTSRDTLGWSVVSFVASVNNNGNLKDTEHHFNLKDFERHFTRRNTEYQVTRKDTEGHLNIQDNKQQWHLKDTDTNVSLKDADTNVYLKDAERSLHHKDTGRHADLKNTNTYADLKDTDPHVGLKDTERHLNRKDTEWHVELKDTERHVGLKDTDQHVGLKDTERHVGLKDTEQHVGLKGTARHVGLKDTERHVGLKDTERYLYLKEPDERVNLKETGWMVAKNVPNSEMQTEAHMSASVDISDTQNPFTKPPMVEQSSEYHYDIKTDFNSCLRIKKVESDKHALSLQVNTMAEGFGNPRDCRHLENCYWKFAKVQESNMEGSIDKTGLTHKMKLNTTIADVPDQENKSSVTLVDSLEVQKQYSQAWEREIEKKEAQEVKQNCTHSGDTVSAMVFREAIKNKERVFAIKSRLLNQSDRTNQYTDDRTTAIVTRNVEPTLSNPYRTEKDQTLLTGQSWSNSECIKAKCTYSSTGADLKDNCSTLEDTTTICSTVERNSSFFHIRNEADVNNHGQEISRIINLWGSDYDKSCRLDLWNKQAITKKKRESMLKKHTHAKEFKRSGIKVHTNEDRVGIICCDRSVSNCSKNVDGAMTVKLTSTSLQPPCEPKSKSITRIEHMENVQEPAHVSNTDTMDPHNSTQRKDKAISHIRADIYKVHTRGNLQAKTSPRKHISNNSICSSIKADRLKRELRNDSKIYKSNQLPERIIPHSTLREIAKTQVVKPLHELCQSVDKSAESKSVNKFSNTVSGSNVPGCVSPLYSLTSLNTVKIGAVSACTEKNIKKDWTKRKLYAISPKSSSVQVNEKSAFACSLNAKLATDLTNKTCTRSGKALSPKGFRDGVQSTVLLSIERNDQKYSREPPIQDQKKNLGTSQPSRESHGNKFSMDKIMVEVLPSADISPKSNISRRQRPFDTARCSQDSHASGVGRRKTNVSNISRLCAGTATSVPGLSRRYDHLKDFVDELQPHTDDTLGQETVSSDLASCQTFGTPTITRRFGQHVKKSPSLDIAQNLSFTRKYRAGSPLAAMGKISCENSRNRRSVFLAPSIGLADISIMKHDCAVTNAVVDVKHCGTEECIKRSKMAVVSTKFCRRNALPNVEAHHEVTVVSPGVKVINRTIAVINKEIPSPEVLSCITEQHINEGVRNIIQSGQETLRTIHKYSNTVYGAANEGAQSVTEEGQQVKECCIMFTSMDEAETVASSLVKSSCTDLSSLQWDKYKLSWLAKSNHNEHVSSDSDQVLLQQDRAHFHKSLNKVIPTSNVCQYGQDSGKSLCSDARCDPYNDKLSYHLRSASKWKNLRKPIASLATISLVNAPPVGGRGSLCEKTMTIPNVRKISIQPMICIPLDNFQEAVARDGQVQTMTHSASVPAQNLDNTTAMVPFPDTHYGRIHEITRGLTTLKDDQPSMKLKMDVDRPNIESLPPRQCVLINNDCNLELLNNVSCISKEMAFSFNPEKPLTVLAEKELIGTGLFHAQSLPVEDVMDSMLEVSLYPASATDSTVNSHAKAMTNSEIKQGCIAKAKTSNALLAMNRFADRKMSDWDWQVKHSDMKLQENGNKVCLSENESTSLINQKNIVSGKAVNEGSGASFSQTLPFKNKLFEENADLKKECVDIIHTHVSNYLGTDPDSDQPFTSFEEDVDSFHDVTSQGVHRSRQTFDTIVFPCPRVNNSFVDKLRDNCTVIGASNMQSTNFKGETVRVEEGGKETNCLKHSPLVNILEEIEQGVHLGNCTREKQNLYVRHIDYSEKRNTHLQGQIVSKKTEHISQDAYSQDCCQIDNPAFLGAGESSKRLEVHMFPPQPDFSYRNDHTFVNDVTGSLYSGEAEAQCGSTRSSSSEDHTLAYVFHSASLSDLHKKHNPHKTCRNGSELLEFTERSGGSRLGLCSSNKMFIMMAKHSKISSTNDNQILDLKWTSNFGNEHQEEIRIEPVSRSSDELAEEEYQTTLRKLNGHQVQNYKAELESVCACPQGPDENSRDKCVIPAKTNDYLSTQWGCKSKEFSNVGDIGKVSSHNADDNGSMNTQRLRLAVCHVSSTQEHSHENGARSPEAESKILKPRDMVTSLPSCTNIDPPARRKPCSSHVGEYRTNMLLYSPNSRALSEDRKSREVVPVHYATSKPTDKLEIGRDQQTNDRHVQNRRSLDAETGVKQTLNGDPSLVHEAHSTHSSARESRQFSQLRSYNSIKYEIDSASSRDTVLEGKVEESCTLDSYLKSGLKHKIGQDLSHVTTTGEIEDCSLYVQDQLVLAKTGTFQNHIAPAFSCTSQKSPNRETFLSSTSQLSPNRKAVLSCTSQRSSHNDAAWKQQKISKLNPIAEKKETKIAHQAEMSDPGMAYTREPGQEVFPHKHNQDPAEKSSVSRLTVTSYSPTRRDALVGSPLSSANHQKHKMPKRSSTESCNGSREKGTQRARQRLDIDYMYSTIDESADSFNCLFIENVKYLKDVSNDGQAKAARHEGSYTALKRKNSFSRQAPWPSNVGSRGKKAGEKKGLGYAPRYTNTDTSPGPSAGSISQVLNLKNQDRFISSICVSVADSVCSKDNLQLSPLTAAVSPGSSGGKYQSPSSSETLCLSNVSDLQMLTVGDYSRSDSSQAPHQNVIRTQGHPIPACCPEKDLTRSLQQKEITSSGHNEKRDEIDLDGANELNMDARLRRRLLQKTSEVVPEESLSWRAKVYQKENTNSSSSSYQHKETRSSFRTKDTLGSIDNQAQDADLARESRRRKSEDSTSIELSERLARRRAKRLEEHRDSISQDGSIDSSHDRDRGWSRDRSVRSVDSAESGECEGNLSKQKTKRRDGDVSTGVDAATGSRRSSRDSAMSTERDDNNEVDDSSYKIWRSRRDSEGSNNGGPDLTSVEFRGRKWSSKDSNFISADSSCSLRSCDDGSRNNTLTASGVTHRNEESTNSESPGFAGEKMRKLYQDRSVDSAFSKSREKSENVFNFNNSNDAAVVPHVTAGFTSVLRKPRLGDFIDESDEIIQKSMVLLGPAANGRNGNLGKMSDGTSGHKQENVMSALGSRSQADFKSSVIFDTAEDKSNKEGASAGSCGVGSGLSDVGSVAGTSQSLIRSIRGVVLEDFKAETEPVVSSESKKRLPVFLEPGDQEAFVSSTALSSDIIVHKRRKKKKDKSSVRKSVLNMADEKVSEGVNFEDTSSLGQEPGHPDEKPRRRPEGSFVSQHASFWENHAPNIQNATPPRQKVSILGRYTGDKEKMTATRQKFMQNATAASETSTIQPASRIKMEPGEDAAPKPIVRGRTDFNQLLQKFSGSESNSERSDTDATSSLVSGIPRRRSFVKRQEAKELISSNEDSDYRKTPERTQSLKLPSRVEDGRMKSGISDNSGISLKMLPEASAAIEKSSSFRSEFMSRKWTQRSVDTPQSQRESSPLKSVGTSSSTVKAQVESNMDTVPSSFSSSKQDLRTSDKYAGLLSKVSDVQIQSDTTSSNLQYKTQDTGSSTFSKRNLANQVDTSISSTGKTSLEKAKSINLIPGLSAKESNTSISVTSTSSPEMAISHSTGSKFSAKEVDTSNSTRSTISREEGKHHTVDSDSLVKLIDTSISTTAKSSREKTNNSSSHLSTKKIDNISTIVESSLVKTESQRTSSALPAKEIEISVVTAKSSHKKAESVISDLSTKVVHNVSTAVDSSLDQFKSICVSSGSIKRSQEKATSLCGDSELSTLITTTTIAPFEKAKSFDTSSSSSTKESEIPVSTTTKSFLAKADSISGNKGVFLKAVDGVSPIADSSLEKKLNISTELLRKDSTSASTAAKTPQEKVKSISMGLSVSAKEVDTSVSTTTKAPFEKAKSFGTSLGLSAKDVDTSVSTTTKAPFEKAKSLGTSLGLTAKEVDTSASTTTKAPFEKAKSLGTSLGVSAKEVDTSASTTMKVPFEKAKSLGTSLSESAKEVDTSASTTTKVPFEKTKSLGTSLGLTAKEVDTSPSTTTKDMLEKAKIKSRLEKSKSLGTSSGLSVMEVDTSTSTDVQTTLDKTENLSVSSAVSAKGVNSFSKTAESPLEKDRLSMSSDSSTKAVDISVLATTKLSLGNVKTHSSGSGSSAKEGDTSFSATSQTSTETANVPIVHLGSSINQVDTSFSVIAKSSLETAKYISTSSVLSAKEVDLTVSTTTKNTLKTANIPLANSEFSVKHTEIVISDNSVVQHVMPTSSSEDPHRVPVVTDTDKSNKSADLGQSREHPLAKPRSSLQRELKPAEHLSTTTISVDSAPKVSVSSSLPSLVSSLESKSTTTSLDVETSVTNEIRRASSFKEATVNRCDSMDRRKGILKRNTSLTAQDIGQPTESSSFPIIDPQLAKILRQRKQLVGDASDKEVEEETKDVVADLVRGAKPLTAAVEIEEMLRHSQQKAAQRGLNPEDEEGLQRISVAERIYSMQTKIEEEKFAAVTPKSRSGLSTPRSRPRSGFITPNQKSVDETLQQSSMSSSVTAVIDSAVSVGNSSIKHQQEPQNGIDSNTAVSGPQLMEKLSEMAKSTEKYQQKRHRFQQRTRNDWRYKTQPVTYEELQAADGLETVSAFRALVRKQTSINALENIKAETSRVTKPLLAVGEKKTEFPQHLTPPSKLVRRSRKLRHRTLPVTAEELNAVPEHQMLVTDPDWVKFDEFGRQDSKADSGILSGSDADSLFHAESMRSLTLDMDMSDADPSRLSVTDKASIFRVLEEKTKAERDKEKSASGAKRYINRKKRERSQTMPITDEEVKSASEMGENRSCELDVINSSIQDNVHQPEEISRLRSASLTEDDSKEQCDDDLIKLSLTEKVRLFSQPREPEKPPTKTEVPVLRRRARKVASRFNTQPVTNEEVEKAAEFSRISPLAMSMVKPPDPELLSVLPLKDQRELMAHHAELFLSQTSLRSRSGSNASQSQPSSRRASVTLEEGETKKRDKEDGSDKSDRKGILKDKSASAKDLHDVRSILKADPVKAKSESEVHSILKMDVKHILESTFVSSEPRGILKKTKSEDASGAEYNEDIKGILKHTDSEDEECQVKPRSRSNSQPLGILKVENASQLVDYSSDIRSILKAPSQENMHDSSQMKSALRRGSVESDTAGASTAVLKSALRTRNKNSPEMEDNLNEPAVPSDLNSAAQDLNSNNSHRHNDLPGPERVQRIDHFASASYTSQVSATVSTTRSSESVDVKSSYVKSSFGSSSSTVTAITTNMRTLQILEGSEVRSGQSASEDGESSTGEILEDTPRTTKLKRKSRFSDRAAKSERYKTQPPELTETTSSTTASAETSARRKFKYEGRHYTQPITPSEMREAEAATPSSDLTSTPGGSIADRLNQLKTSGEEEWRKRVGRKEEMLASPDLVKLQERTALSSIRPVSIADRLNELETSMTTWKERVEESDAKQFTVAGRLTHGPTESPLYSKLKNLPRKDDAGSKGNSPLSSPVTPTKEFIAKIPLPKDIVQDTSISVESISVTVTGGRGDEPEAKREPVKVEVPDMGQEIENFFAVKSIEEIKDKVEMEVDDFNNIFIEAEMILSTVRKVRPVRKTRPTSQNPLKTMSQKLEIRQEYTEVLYGTAEKELKRVKKEALAKDAGFAQAALAGLASNENFKQVELRRTDSGSSVHGQALDPFKELMLLHVKGRRSVQTRLVEPHTRSINEGDCYILVTADKVIHWEGRYANVIEKAKASEVANYIQQKKDLGCKKASEVSIVNQDKDHLGAGKLFWAALEGEKQFQACGPDAEDELYESSVGKCNMVYRLEGNALKPYEEYWGTIPTHEMLKKNEVIIFDFGTEFYVWQGKAVSMEQRKLGLKLSKQLYEKGYDYSESPINPISPLRTEESGGQPMNSPTRPKWSIFGKVNQNMETILFREKFSDWPDSSRLIGCRGHGPSDGVSKDLLELKPFDAKRLTPLNTTMVNLKLDGANLGRGVKWSEDMQGFVKEQDIITLDVTVWHVLEYEHYKLPELSHGQFHDGDTYVVRWQYMIANANLRSLKGQAARNSLTGRERCAYFFWQGNQSTINEKGASALMTVELDEERGPQVRVLQGKEPPCFLNLFGGRMVLHIGKREDPATNTQGSWRLYCLRGDYENEVYLLEIPVSVHHLRSRSSMILLNVKTGIFYIWHGAKSAKHVRDLCLNIVTRLKENTPLELGLHEKATITVVEVEEGSERREMWSALDKQDRTIYHSLLTDSRPYNHTIRLFHMSSVNLVFEVHEQLNPARVPDLVTPFPFLQADLYKATQPALFLVDTEYEVYLWQGWWPVGSHDYENVQTGSAIARFNLDRRLAMETTLHYCREKDPSKPLTAYLVCAGIEPGSFTSLFPYWEEDTIVKDIAIEEGKALGYMIQVSEVLQRLTETRYSLVELQERPLPDGVDPLKLETYLFDADFEEILDMTRDEFYAQPQWKQIDVKKHVGLF